VGGTRLKAYRVSGRLVAAACAVTRGRIVIGIACPVDPTTLGLKCPPVNGRLLFRPWAEDSPDDANGNCSRHSQNGSRNKSIQIDQPLVGLILT
jgi:hypothetical protein